MISKVPMLKNLKIKTKFLIADRNARPRFPGRLMYLTDKFSAANQTIHRLPS
jgi:hypothetical protein